jgi:hypothetical protein
MLSRLLLLLANLGVLIIDLVVENDGHTANAAVCGPPFMLAVAPVKINVGGYSGDCSACLRSSGRTA